MAKLGDLFPDNLKNEVISGNLKIGSVFRTFERNTNPPKIKRFIVVGISTDSVMFATVYINTDINPHLFNTQELISLHIPIIASNTPYIEHDSYIDCSQINERNIGELRATYENDMESHLGDVTAAELKLIREKIKNTRTIPLKKKKNYGLLF